MSTFMKREASVWLNYPGDVCPGIEDQIEAGVPMGPTTLNEPLWPVEVDYDAKKDQTRVGFSYIAPPEKVMA